MRWRRPAKARVGRNLGITFVILGLLHTPLPEADFHNIRHHDAPGEVCELHDHLLRWHPDAVAAQDVAVLHWHWFWPGDPNETPVDGSSGAALHAHAPGWMTGVWNDDGPSVAPDVASRPLDRFPVPPPEFLLTTATAPPLSRGPRVVPASRAPLARGISLTSLLQRWVC